MKTLELPEEIRLPKEEIDAFLKRVEDTLGPKDHAIARAHVETVGVLRNALDHKGVSIERLKQLLFGARTETLERLLPESEAHEEEPPAPKPKPKRKPRGHGRNGAAAYPGAKQVEVTHPTLSPGDSCPCCQRGKIYDTKRPATEMRFRAQPPVEATAFRSQTMRCNRCGEILRGELPKEAGTQKYDETVGSNIVLLKYGSGMPFYRLAKLQSTLGVPLPPATQWEIVAEAAEKCAPVWDALISHAAQAQLVHNDDTDARILDIEKEIREARKRNEEPERTGIYTNEAPGCLVPASVSRGSTEQASHDAADSRTLRSRGGPCPPRRRGSSRPGLPARVHHATSPGPRSPGRLREGVRRATGRRLTAAENPRQRLFRTCGMSGLPDFVL